MGAGLSSVTVGDWATVGAIAASSALKTTGTLLDDTPMVLIEWLKR